MQQQSRIHGVRRFLIGFLASRRLWLLFVAVLVLFLGFVVWPTRGEIQLVAPDPVPLFLDRHGTYLTETGGDLPRGFWPVAGAEGERLSLAVRALEDQRFGRHGGVEFRSLLRAFVNNCRGGPRQGGSTLAMQVARMQRPRSRSYGNKLREIWVAWRLTRAYGREAVLAHYLRLMPQGNRIHGGAYAAQYYFRKPLADLSWAEAAMLAALPNAPGRMNLHHWEGLIRAKHRARRALVLLAESGTLPADELDIALRSLESMQPVTASSRPGNSMHAILQVLKVSPALSVADLAVRTELDLEIQEQVTQLVHACKQRMQWRGVKQLAVMVADRRSGGIRAYVGSADYWEEGSGGAIDYCQVPRSSGSTLKPFLYAMGLASGRFSSASVLDDLPLAIANKGGHYAVGNGDGKYLGPMLFASALANSRNVPAADLLSQLGIEPVYRYFQSLGLDRLQLSGEYYGLSLALGGMYVTLFDLVAAYGTLANDGIQWQPQWIPGRKADDPKLQRINQDAARLVVRFLSDPLSRLPSFPRGGPLEYPFPVAVKTGTSQGFRDAWALAFDAYWVVGAWLGDPDHQPMNSVTGMDAARLVQEILLMLSPHGVQDVDRPAFPPPAGFVPVALCPWTGARAGALCDRRVTAYFPPGRVPLSETDAHQPGTDPVAGEGQTYLRLPARYDAWMKHQGYPAPPLLQPVTPNIARIDIQTPVNHGAYFLDPDVPASLQSLPLQAVVQPRVPAIQWFVNGQPYKESPFPYRVHLPLQPGSHVIQARFPHAEVWSQPVRIEIHP